MRDLSDKNGVHFGVFTYDVNGLAVQTFSVNNPNHVPVKYVQFQVLNNHGNDAYTCVYRLRVHGAAVSV